MAKRTPVVLETPGTENITGKPRAWILTSWLPWASRRLRRSTVLTTSSIDLPVNSSPKT
ncbi:MAG: hypothetical protein WBH85_03760 [Thermoanaerobaculia bacterium]